MDIVLLLIKAWIWQSTREGWGRAAVADCCPKGLLQGLALWLGYHSHQLGFGVGGEWGEQSKWCPKYVESEHKTTKVTQKQCGVSFLRYPPNNLMSLLVDFWRQGRDKYWILLSVSRGWEWDVGMSTLGCWNEWYGSILLLKLGTKNTVKRGS